MKQNKKLIEQTEIKVSGVVGFFQKDVTKFGTGAKIDCPKEHIGKPVYVIVRKQK